MASVTSTITELRTSKEARGKRLKTARMQSGLSRLEIERKYGVSNVTQGNWENGKSGGLTEKGAKRMVHVFKQEGLHCTLEWLLDGIGSAPYPTDQLFIPPANRSGIRIAETPGHTGIEEELLAFRRCNKDALDLKVTDDGMLPKYHMDDYVAGVQYFDTDIQKAIGEDCIVLLKDKKMLLRHVRRGANNTLTLVCINPDTTAEPYLLADQEVISVAPVIWHRRKAFK